MTNKTLTHGTPEAQGIASSAILAFIEAAEKDIDSLHSFMLLRHGAVVAQGWWSPYATEYPHMLYSLSKSFTSTTMGLAVADGLLSVDDPVLSFFPEDAPKTVSRNLAAMRVRHMLSMCTGHAQDTTEYLFKRRDGNWVKAFLARPVKYKPGTHFLYNTGASYMLSAIVQKLTGMTILDYLGERIFAPLGIEGATWGTCPRGINLGGFGLNVKTEDIAKFGQLYLQKGRWNGEQLLPEAWVEEATRSHIDNAPKEAHEPSDWTQGYGYQFWRCQPQNVYRGDGAHGQYCIVMPDQDAVMAITSGVSDMQAVMTLVWTQLLPAMQPDPLPADSEMQMALEQKLASLVLPPVAGEATSPTAARVTGKRFVFEKNLPRLKSVACEFGADGAILTLRNAGGVQRIVCGQDTWIKGAAQLGREIAGQIAASGAWTDENTYTAKIYFYEAPFRVTLTCHFDEEQLTFNFKQNVSFGPTEWPQLVGQAR
jgi:CubicO group peptidase (beta-lactamase class C family)